jgi:hypothetical protein
LWWKLEFSSHTLICGFCRKNGHTKQACHSNPALAIKPIKLKLNRVKEEGKDTAMVFKADVEDVVPQSSVSSVTARTV